ncbi:MAG: hypothetical protein U1E28_05830 [Beijerinckiaceae bacterium]
MQQQEGMARIFGGRTQFVKMNAGAVDLDERAGRRFAALDPPRNHERRKSEQHKDGRRNQGEEQPVHFAKCSAEWKARRRTKASSG